MKLPYLMALVVSTTFACSVGDSGGGDDDDGDDVSEIDAGSTEPAAYMEACDPEAAEPCEGDNECFEFNADGPHCTHDCTEASDCEAPSSGCNGMGKCKTP
jgi:hypothetical protein